jgi:hypothetical protein
MRSVRFGVDDERFIGSGVVNVNQFAEDPYPEGDSRLGAACNTKYRDLKLRFREESWRPDIEEYRLKAEVTGSTVSEIMTLINNSSTQ